MENRLLSIGYNPKQKSYKGYLLGNTKNVTDTKGHQTNPVYRYSILRKELYKDVTSKKEDTKKQEASGRVRRVLQDIGQLLENRLLK